MRITRRDALAVVAVAFLTLSSSCFRSPASKEASFLERGKVLRGKRDFSRASIEFRNAMAIMPKDAEPAYQLGITYENMGDVRHAAAYLNRAIELNPKHPDAQLRLARLLATSGNRANVSDAQRRIKEVLIASPENPEAVDILAITEFKLGDTGQAMNELETVLSRSPGLLKSSAELARMKTSVGDLAGAEKVLKQAAIANPKSPDAALLLGSFYMQRSRFSDAEAQSRRARAIDQKNGKALLLLGVAQDRQGRRDDAEATLKRLSRFPDPTLQPLYGMALFEHGKTDAAVEEFARLHAEDPSDRTARTRLVSALLKLHRDEEADRVLAQAISKNKKDVDAVLQRAFLALTRGKVNDAESDLLAVTAIDRSLPVVHYGLAQVHRLRGDESLYRQELGEAVRRNGDFLKARIELADSLSASNAGQSALNVLQEAPPEQQSTVVWQLAHNEALFANHDYTALRKEFDAPRAQHIQAVMLQDATFRSVQKDYRGARLIFQQVLQQDPRNIGAVRLLAETYAKEGNSAMALSTVRTYAQQQQNFPPLQELLAATLMQAGRLQDARPILETAQLQHPEFYPARLLLAQLDFAEHKPEAGKQILTSILSAAPSNVPARVTYAKALLSAGDQTRAIAQYKTALNYAPLNWVALNDLAYLLAKSDPDKALAYAQAALATQPGNPVVLDTVGWVDLHKGSYASAVTELESAVAKGGTATRKYHLAMAYFKAGETSKGQEMLRSALTLDPNLLRKEHDEEIWSESPKQ